MAAGAPKTYDITGEQAYELVAAALDLVGGVSPAVLARCRREGSLTNRPMVNPVDLGHLADVLDSIRPGIVNALFENERKGS